MARPPGQVTVLLLETLSRERAAEIRLVREGRSQLRCRQDLHPAEISVAEGGPWTWRSPLMPADGFLAADLMLGFRRARCSFADKVSPGVCTSGSGIADYQYRSFASEPG